MYKEYNTYVYLYVLEYVMQVCHTYYQPSGVQIVQNSVNKPAQTLLFPILHWKGNDYSNGTSNDTRTDNGICKGIALNYVNNVIFCIETGIIKVMVLVMVLVLIMVFEKVLH